MNAEYVPGKATADYLERMQGRIHVEEGCIVITISDDNNIPLNKCDSYEKILAWVFHLSEQTEITKEDLKYFITEACNASNIDIPRV